MPSRAAQPYLDDGDVQLYHGDALTVLQGLPAGIAQTCVTSPPYWGLRAYGTGTWTGGDPACQHEPRSSGGPSMLQGASQRGRSDVGACRCGAQRVDSQLGLEATPAEYVENMVNLFREVGRVLRDDGTLWLNLGDSYATGGGRSVGRNDKAFGAISREPRVPFGFKEKDLVGIPWRVAFALQQPYYTGTIRNELDRVWLAAMIDAEGCLFIHKRKTGQSNGQGYVRKNDTYGSGMEIANCHESIVRRCMEITGRGSISVQTRGRNQPLYRWNLRSNECREVIREVYPYLVGKQHQARLTYCCPSSGDKAEAAHAGLMLLHNGGLTDVDFPAPPSCLEPGWYLRSDVIWSKSNPMPESVTDRPTKSHEYLFLLTKGPRYFYDADAIREDGAGRIDFGNMNDRETWARKPSGRGPWTGTGKDEPNGRNRRSVWTIPTEPFPEAHFATYPQALVTPCIQAGTSERGGCAECGAPWRRVVVASGGTVGESWHNHADDLARGQRGGDAGNAAAEGWKTYQRETTGWEPSCPCIEQAIHDDPTPAQLAGRVHPQLVLDPFVGSGTTALVARKHGRRCIGIDLSAEYLQIAAKRTQQLSLLGQDAGRFVDTGTLDVA